MDVPSRLKVDRRINGKRLVGEDGRPWRSKRRAGWRRFEVQCGAGRISRRVDFRSAEYQMLGFPSPALSRYYHRHASDVARSG